MRHLFQTLIFLNTSILEVSRSITRKLVKVIHWMLFDQSVVPMWVPSSVLKWFLGIVNYRGFFIQPPSYLQNNN